MRESMHAIQKEFPSRAAMCIVSLFDDTICSQKCNRHRCFGKRRPRGNTIIMHDPISILRGGHIYWGHRFLREDGDGRTRQTIFFENRLRCDPSGYTRFASDDPTMNERASALLAQMVDSTAGPNDGTG